MHYENVPVRYYFIAADKYETLSQEDNKNGDFESCRGITLLESDDPNKKNCYTRRTIRNSSKR